MQTCKSVQYFLSYSGFKSRPSFSMTLYGISTSCARRPILATIKQTWFSSPLKKKRKDLKIFVIKIPRHTLTIPSTLFSSKCSSSSDYQTIISSLIHECYITFNCTHGETDLHISNNGSYLVESTTHLIQLILREKSLLFWQSKNQCIIRGRHVTLLQVKARGNCS